MDMGVGSFVFSQGVVSAIPLLKDPLYLTSPLIPKTTRTLRKTLPVILLGLVRVLLVKGTEYPVKYFHSSCRSPHIMIVPACFRNTSRNTASTGTSS